MYWIPGWLTVGGLQHGVQSSQLAMWWMALDSQISFGSSPARPVETRATALSWAPELLSRVTMAADVITQVPGPVDFRVGHSLGLNVALPRSDPH
jgi:hypothetical protein